MGFQQPAMSRSIFRRLLILAILMCSLVEVERVTTGNIRFRKMVEDRKEEHKKCHRQMKKNAMLDIVYTWRAQDPRGRFLKMNNQDECYAYSRGAGRGTGSQALALNRSVYE
mmetsp:Transcript_9174/g.13884  ORF Transcript_9174/g.13884 Transcript_9174/m.13884 type:complete len:112 (+) Transcript_9174:58-393(+)